MYKATGHTLSCVCINALWVQHNRATFPHEDVSVKEASRNFEKAHGTSEM